MLAVAVETTARVQALHALRASEERQSFLLELSDALRPVVDPDRILALATRLLAQQLGAPRAYYADFDPRPGPKGVAAQSRARQRARISPGPANSVCAA